jgi:hypothetical protein
MTRTVMFAMSVLALASTPALVAGQPAKPPQKPAAPLTRWVDVQNATLNVRYRFIDTSEGVITTNQIQHRETLRGRFKFDTPGRYALNFGASTGQRFTSGWNNTGIGLGDFQGPLSARILFLAAQPITGVEGQYGSMYIVRGESTEITTYDEDGYIIGERVSVRRPKQLYFDEMTATIGYFSSTSTELGFSRRVKYLNDQPNYGHFLVDKKFGTRGGVSADYTSVDGAHTWRAATNLNTKELRAVDSILFENYKRTNNTPAYGFAVTATKGFTRKLSLSGGYASIDQFYGGLNADRFHVGNRLFGTLTYVISPRFTASAFLTRAVGNDFVLVQRTLSNLIFAYNALPDIRRTGWF